MSANWRSPAVISRYVRASKREIGRTKKQVLDVIKDAAIGGMHCSEVTSQAIVSFAQQLGVQSQTVGNYISHLAAVFNIAVLHGVIRSTCSK